MALSRTGWFREAGPTTPIRVVVERVEHKSVRPRGVCSRVINGNHCRRYVTAAEYVHKEPGIFIAWHIGIFDLKNASSDQNRIESRWCYPATVVDEVWIITEVFVLLYRSKRKWLQSVSVMSQARAGEIIVPC